MLIITNIMLLVSAISGETLISVYTLQCITLSKVEEIVASLQTFLGCYF